MLEIFVVPMIGGLEIAEAVMECKIKETGKTSRVGHKNKPADPSEKWMFIKDGQLGTLIVQYGVVVTAINYQCVDYVKPVELTVSWVIPIARQNKKPLSLDQISHYEMTVIINDPLVQKIQVIGTDDICFSLKTVDNNGIKSELSKTKCSKK